MANMQWISVRERLPENEDMVIVAYDSGSVYRDYYSKTKRDWAFQHRGKVTHWMPFPPHPGKDEMNES